MKFLSAFLGILVILLLVPFFYQHRKTAELEAALDALGRDREALNTQLRKLDGRIAELQKERGTSSSAVEAPRVGSNTAAPAAAVIEQPVATPGVSVTAPTGWARNGRKAESYVVGVDQVQTWGGMPSAYVRSLQSSVDGFGGMMQTTSAEDFVGKRVRLSGWIKTEDANEGGGHLWLRVDGQQQGVSLQFDNMDNRAAKGTTDWQEASVVLDVPTEASALAFGFFVQGGGKMWVSGTKMEEVGPDVPSTNMLKPQTQQQQRRVLPKAPVNLGFYPDAPK